MARYGKSPLATTYTEWTLERIEDGVSDMRDSINPQIQAQDNRFRAEAIYLDNILKDLRDTLRAKKIIL